MYPQVQKNIYNIFLIMLGGAPPPERPKMWCARRRSME